jgi:hypothetical protein
MDYLDLMLHRLQVRKPTGAQIIEHADAAAARHQCFHEMRTDESGSAGDQTAAHRPPLQGTNFANPRPGGWQLAG